MRNELREAAEGNAELLSHTIHNWAKARVGNLSNILPEALANELRRDLPQAPIDLIKTALNTELFETDPFKGTLGVLRDASSDLSISTLDALAPFPPKTKQELPVGLGEGATDLDIATLRVATAMSSRGGSLHTAKSSMQQFSKIVSKNNPSRSLYARIRLSA